MKACQDCYPQAWLQIHQVWYTQQDWGVSGFVECWLINSFHMRIGSEQVWVTLRKFNWEVTLEVKGKWFKHFATYVDLTFAKPKSLSILLNHKAISSFPKQLSHCDSFQTICPIPHSQCLQYRCSRSCSLSPHREQCRWYEECENFSLKSLGLFIHLYSRPIWHS